MCKLKPFRRQSVKHAKENKKNYVMYMKVRQSHLYNNFQQNYEI